MKTIHKAPLAVAWHQSILIAPTAEILCVQMQHGLPTLWYLTDPVLVQAPRVIFCFGTGDTINEEAVQYIGTVQDQAGYFWHYFQERRT